jgi:ABC-type multidrug transport system permease subunit
MNWKKLWLAALLVFVAYFATNMLIHVVILGDEYMKPEIQKAMRSDAEMKSYFWVRIVTTVVFSFFFTFIFAKGYERKGIMEGVRFGIYVTFFYFFVTCFEQFIIYPIPYRVVWYWIVAGLVQSVIMGIIAALVYRPKGAPATTAK